MRICFGSIDHPSNAFGFCWRKPAVLDQRGHQVLRGPAEQPIDHLHDFGTQRREPRSGGGIDKRPAFDAVAEPAFVLQPHDHRLDGVPSHGAPFRERLPHLADSGLAVARGSPLGKYTSRFYVVLRSAIPLLLIVWIAGSAILLAKLAVGCRRLARILRAAKPNMELAIEESLAWAGRALRVRNLPELVLSDRVSGPFSAGVSRPRIVLPERIVSQVTPQQLRDILLHEAAHVVRHDQAVVLLQNIVTALFWFHPLVMAMNRQLAQASEEVCDNYVLAWTDAPSYSRTLLMLAQLVQSGGSVPAAAGLFMSRWKLETRVAGLLDERRNRGIRLTRRGRLLVGLIAIAQAAVAACGTISLAEQGADNAASANASTSYRETNEPAETIPDDGSSRRNFALSTPDGPAREVDDALPKGAILRLGTDRFRQEGEAQMVRYSPDGKKLASISGDSVVVWDAGTGRRLRWLHPERRSGPFQGMTQTHRRLRSRRTANGLSPRTITRPSCCGTSVR